MATARTSSKSSQSNEHDNWFHAQKNIFGDMQEQWSGFLKEWQNVLSHKSDAIPGAESYQNFFAQAGQQFLGMMQQFQQGAGAGKKPEDTAKDWIAEMQKQFSSVFQPGDGYANFMHLGESMMKAGSAFASSFQNGGPFAQNPKGMGAFDPFGFGASMPGIGYTREKQEAVAELYKRFATFQKATDKYNASMAKVGLEALQKFQAYVFNPPKDAPPLTSLKSVYVKWVDICEEIYAKYAMTEEYTRLYGENVNALMSFKMQQNKLTDDAVAEFNLPTRKEIDSLHQRLHDVRRENIQLKKDVAELKKAVFKATPSAPKKAPTTVKAAKPVKKSRKK